ncbi:MAG: hypothetical protein JSW73_03795 [Candidatus Woesearchaeota archaeon]|nr:MAG: hypothetical protein JSW73_03795 [Candidatus Woesearchaeota archaeon]
MEKFPGTSELLTKTPALENIIDLIPSNKVIDPILDDVIIKALEEEGGRANKDKIIRKFPKKVIYFLESAYNTDISNIVANRGEAMVTEGKLIVYGLHDSYQIKDSPIKIQDIVTEELRNAITPGPEGARNYI